MSANNYKYTFSIFTPVYNRVRTMPRLYESIRNLNWPKEDLEWIIIDDGSSDNIGDLVFKWKNETEFHIKFYSQENSGKHVAINRGVSIAEGYFFFIVDSDDWLPQNALKVMFNAYKKERQNDIAGVWGLCVNPEGEIIGSKFPQDGLVTTLFEVYWKHEVKGDKKGFVLTDTMRRYPFPENLGKFVPEALVWNRIDKNICFINIPVMYVEYLEGGLSSRIHVLRASSPLSSIEYYTEFIRYGREKGISGKFIFRASINLMRFAIHARRPVRKENIQLKWPLLATLLGFLLFCRDRLLMYKDARSSES